MSLRKALAVVSFFGAFALGAGAAYVVNFGVSEGFGEVVSYEVYAPPVVEEMPLEAAEVVGVWSGTWGYGRENCTIEIHRFDGEKFKGTLWKEGAVIKLEGWLDKEARKLNFKETKVVKLGPHMSKWSLGINSGRFSADGRTLTGIGLDEWGVYDWDAKKGLRHVGK